MRTFDNGVWTSEEAAEKADKERNKGLVLGVLLAAGPAGLTDDEIQVLLGMDGNSERPARVALRKEGFVQDTENTRLTRRGRKAIVRVAYQEAIEHLESMLRGVDRIERSIP